MDRRARAGPPGQRGPVLPTVWLHSTHQQLAGVSGKPCPWCTLPTSGARTPQSRELAIRTLVERAATGFELSTAPSDLDSESLASFRKGCQLSNIPPTAHFEVTLGTSDLMISSILESNLSLPPSMLRVPLLFSDVMWTSLPLTGESGHAGSTMNDPVSPRYIVAVVPHEDEGDSGIAVEDERNTEPVSAAHGLPFQEAWLLCVGACSQSDLQDFLRELGCRGAIRWDLKKCYYLERELNSGGCSTVYLGQSLQHFEGRSITSPASNSADVQAATQVAVKRLKVHARLTQTVVKSEIDFLVQCRGHPNITQLYGSFCSCWDSGRECSEASEQADLESSSQLCWSMVMELFPRGDLHEYLMRSGPLPEADAMEIFCGVMSALAHLHFWRVAHRDVKAENILLSDKGQAVLADFGLAARIDDQLAMNEHIGSPGYAAPEVVDARPYGVKADVFSAGVVLYFALSSELPFPGTDMATRLRRTARCKVRFGLSMFGQLSGGVLVLLRALLEKNPQLRPSSGCCFEASWLSLPAEGQRRSLATLVAYTTLVPNRAERLQQPDEKPLEQQKEHRTPSEHSSVRRADSTIPPSSSSGISCLSSLTEPVTPRSRGRRKEDVFSPQSCREQNSLVSRLLDTVEEARLPHWAGAHKGNVHAEEEGTLQVQSKNNNMDDARLVLVPPAVPLTANRFFRSRLSFSRPRRLQ